MGAQDCLVKALLRDIALVLDSPGIDEAATGSYHSERTRCHGCGAEADGWGNAQDLKHDAACSAAAAQEAEKRLREALAAGPGPQSACEPQPIILGAVLEGCVLSVVAQQRDAAGAVHVVGVMRAEESRLRNGGAMGQMRNPGQDLPEKETKAMHDAVMAVLYRGGVTRTGTNELWQAYRDAILGEVKKDGGN